MTIRESKINIHLCQECGDGFEVGDEVVSLSDGTVYGPEDVMINSERYWHLECYREAKRKGKWMN